MISADPASLPASRSPSPGLRPPRAYTRIDWKAAAGLLADGQTARQAATAIGITEDRLWRHWQRSQRFRNHVQALIERRRGLLGLQLGPAAAAAALARCQAQEELTVDAAMLALLAGGDLRPDAPAISVQERVAAIGRAGRRKAAAAAGHASSSRPAAPKPASDRPPGGSATVVVKQLFAARMKPAVTPSPGPEPAAPAASIPEPPAPPAAAQAGSAPVGPERAETVASGPERDKTVTSGTERDELVQSGANTTPPPQQPGSAGDESDPPRPRFRARPDFITDLPSPDFPDGIPYARDNPG